MLTFIKKLEEFYGELDRGLKRALDVHPVPVTCPTCTSPACCNQKIVIDFHEALPIAKLIKERGVDSPALRGTLKQLGDEMEGASRPDWFRRDQPCLFLDPEKRCAIYPVRPQSCRTYFVTSPQDACQNVGQAQAIELIDVSRLTRGALLRGRAVHQELGLKESMYRMMQGALPRVLLVALEALDRPGQHSFADHVRNQIWPSAEQLAKDWIDGDNPFGRGDAHTPTTPPPAEMPGLCKHAIVYSCVACNRTHCLGTSNEHPNCDARIDEHRDEHKSIAKTCHECEALGDEWRSEVHKLRYERAFLPLSNEQRHEEIAGELRRMGCVP